MKLHIFGSCAGTEPIAGWHHTAWALETEHGLYWFDAGETCSYTAHLMGLDLLRVRSVFISHTHMDHVGGLGNLFWNIRKLTYVTGRNVEQDIDLFIPRMSSWDAILALLKNTEGGFACKFGINAHGVEDGVIYDRDGVKVEALHNRHLEAAPPWHSFSYRITCEGKTIVFSGDVKSSEDLDPYLADGCDLLMMETGHHDPDVIARYLSEHRYDVKKLAYIHNGVCIRETPDKAADLIRAAWDGEFMLLHDEQTIEL
ncbi:MAG: MBL fold metallo-hydrolase [Ruminococcaceae bacterium]|nr:MBL fold metallo-hydrolase [Oscillospiraceae bacterium]